MPGKTIFELTWIGSDDRLKLEPSILLEGLDKITIKVINHYGDEALKIFEV